LLLVAPFAALGAGCGLFDRETDRRVNDFLRSGSTFPIVRGQAPIEGPLPPVSLPPPAAPVEPLKSPTEAPIIPLTGRPDVVPADQISRTPVITPVDARIPTAHEAETRVKVVATIGADVIITDEEISLLMKQRANEYLNLKGEEREKKEAEVYRDSLRMLIERELILADFLGKVKKNKPGVLPELWEQASRMADNQIREMRKAYKSKKLETEADFARELDAQGMSYKLFRKQIERGSLVNMFISTAMREKNGTPTLAQVQDYYTRNKADFWVDDRVKYLDLFVSTARFSTSEEAKKYADDLFKKALGGADFVELIKQYGHGDSPLRDGVGIGERRGEIQPVVLEQTVFGLKQSNISGVIPTETGYHILKVTEREVAGYRPFDEKVQSEIRNRLLDQMVKTEREKMVAELWRKIGVTIVER
jgi:parvulin-like peptidyl-prolyl isomerase